MSANLCLLCVSNVFSPHPKACKILKAFDSAAQLVSHTSAGNLPSKFEKYWITEKGHDMIVSRASPGVYDYLIHSATDHLGNEKLESDHEFLDPGAVSHFVFVSNKDGGTVLHQAASKCDVSKLEFLEFVHIDDKADFIATSNNAGMTSIDVAATVADQHAAEFICLLLSHLPQGRRSDLLLKVDNKKQTVLHLAAFHQKDDKVISVLLDNVGKENAGLLILMSDDLGLTAILLAAQQKNLTAVQLMVDSLSPQLRPKIEVKRDGTIKLKNQKKKSCSVL